LKRLRFQILLFILARIIVNTMHRMVYPFLAVIGRGLGVDLAMVSLAVTARAGSGILGPFLASVADSRGRKTGMLLGMGLFIAAMVVVILWPTFPSFVLALVLTVLSKYIFDPSMQAYLGDKVPYARRGLVIATTELGWSFAFILGVPLMGFLIARGTWKAPLPVLAVAGIALFLLLAWNLPGDPQPDGRHPGIWRNLQKVVVSPLALVSLSIGLTVSISNEMVNLVFGVWMEDAFGLQIAALGAASAVIGLSELGGEGLTAILADRLGKLRAVGLGIAASITAALLLPVLGGSLPGALVGLFIFYITFEFTLVSSIPLMTEILPEARATLMSVNVATHSLGRAVGAMMAVPVYKYGILASCAAAVAFDIAGLLALIWLSRHFDGDHHA
jgi:predicted MFS family arabinose efflux permease